MIGSAGDDVSNRSGRTLKDAEVAFRHSAPRGRDAIVGGLPIGWTGLVPIEYDPVLRIEGRTSAVIHFLKRRASGLSERRVRE